MMATSNATASLLRPQPHGSPRVGPPRRILVLGSGNFGSCLADHLATSDNLRVDVTLWSRDAETVKSLNETHHNPKYLTDHVSCTAL